MMKKIIKKIKILDGFKLTMKPLQILIQICQLPKAYLSILNDILAETMEFSLFNLQLRSLPSRL
ncbi:hypothetical protein BpHYR1_022714 [Brachionus plicatilis]|uniref:Uncharacterized protein n=1 Tax=Brachionus plicatilis TaxID=10195 RepID=A0A3M7T7E1_BRAPC|nr:hypothetical protein BpHYR1_022714 [Brachionus plicatilis]